MEGTLHWWGDENEIRDTNATIVGILRPDDFLSKQGERGRNEEENNYFQFFWLIEFDGNAILKENLVIKLQEGGNHIWRALDWIGQVKAGH